MAGHAAKRACRAHGEEATRWACVQGRAKRCLAEDGAAVLAQAMADGGACELLIVADYAASSSARAANCS